MKTPVNFQGSLRKVMVIAAMTLALGVAGVAQQAPSALGTVKSISGTTITIANAQGATIMVDESASPTVLELPPGNTTLSAAKPGALGDVAVGDRALVTGKAGDPATALNAVRIILMKSGDLAKEHATELADWQRNGAGGLVSAVDAGAGTITINTGATQMAQQKTVIHTNPKTVFLRYANDSIAFENAKPGTLAQVQVGDQLRVRGVKTPGNIDAAEIVSGTFKNVAGPITAVDTAAGAVTIKDLGTKKNMVVKITANSDLRNLPPQMAAMFAAPGAAGARGGRGGAAGAGGDQGSSGGDQGGGVQRGGQGGGQGGQRGGAQGGQNAQGGPGGGGMRRPGSADIAQMLPRMPKITVADLKNGQVVMVTATQASPSSTDLTVVNLLAGADPILTAAPSMTLGVGGAGGGGGGGEGGDGGGGGGGGGFGGGGGGL